MLRQATPQVAQVSHIFQRQPPASFIQSSDDKDGKQFFDTMFNA